jgi:hypothetical protein
MYSKNSRILDELEAPIQRIIEIVKTEQPMYNDDFKIELMKELISITKDENLADICGSVLDCFSQKIKMSQ